MWSKSRFCAAVAIAVSTTSNTRLQKLQEIGAVNGWVDDKAIVVVRNMRMYDIDWHCFVCFCASMIDSGQQCCKNEKKGFASCFYREDVDGLMAFVSWNVAKRCVVWSNQKLAKQCCVLYFRVAVCVWDPGIKREDIRRVC